MSDDYKDIPTLEEIITPGKTYNTEDTGEESNSQQLQTGEQVVDNRQGDRRSGDRRVSKQALLDDQIERRIDQRRARQRREQDKENSRALDEMVDQIMRDMMPDLEQHIRLQLRFEIEKHMPDNIKHEFSSDAK